MIHYLLRFPLWLATIALRYPAAVLAVLLWSSTDQRSLTRWHWLETIDNDLSGDAGWKAEHLSGSDPLSSWNRIRWLWRNGGNRFNYWTIGVPDSPAPSWAFWSKRAVPLLAGRFLDLRFGWSPEGPKQGRRKYVFTMRIKTKP